VKQKDFSLDKMLEKLRFR